MSGGNPDPLLEEAAQNPAKKPRDTMPIKQPRSHEAARKAAQQAGGYEEGRQALRPQESAASNDVPGAKANDNERDDAPLDLRARVIEMRAVGDEGSGCIVVLDKGRKNRVMDGHNGYILSTATGRMFAGGEFQIIHLGDNECTVIVHGMSLDEMAANRTAMIGPSGGWVASSAKQPKEADKGKKKEPDRKTRGAQTLHPRIIEYSTSDAGTRIILDRGNAHGVAAGWYGQLGRTRFFIDQVGESECFATIKMSLEEVQNLAKDNRITIGPE